jgi:hypothetical protein
VERIYQDGEPRAGLVSYVYDAAQSISADLGATPAASPAIDTHIPGS